MASASCPPLTSPAAVARNLLESRAQAAYAIYIASVPLFESRAWAHLPETARQGWRDVVEWIESAEPLCPKCHKPIYCHKCGGDS